MSYQPILPAFLGWAAHRLKAMYASDRVEFQDAANQSSVLQLSIMHIIPKRRCSIIHITIFDMKRWICDEQDVV